ERTHRDVRAASVQRGHVIAALEAAARLYEARLQRVGDHTVERVQDQLRRRILRQTQLDRSAVIDEIEACAARNGAIVADAAVDGLETALRDCAAVDQGDAAHGLRERVVDAATELEGAARRLQPCDARLHASGNAAAHRLREQLTRLTRQVDVAGYGIEVDAAAYGLDHDAGVHGLDPDTCPAARAHRGSMAADCPTPAATAPVCCRPRPHRCRSGPCHARARCPL